MGAAILGGILVAMLIMWLLCWLSHRSKINNERSSDAAQANDAHAVSVPEWAKKSDHDYDDAAEEIADASGEWLKNQGRENGNTVV